MDKAELIKSSGGLVEQIEESMSTIETITAAIDNVDQGKLSLLLVDGEIVETGLNEEQQNVIKNIIKDNLTNNMCKAVDFLKLMNAKRAAWETPEVSQKVTVNKPAAKTGGKRFVFVKEDLERLLSDGVKVADIAARYGCSAWTVYDQIRKLGVKNVEPVSTDAVLDGNRIKDMYVNQRMSQGDIAEALGVSKKIIHEFINTLHIYRPDPDEDRREKTGAAKVSAR